MCAAIPHCQEDGGGVELCEVSAVTLLVFSPDPRPFFPRRLQQSHVLFTGSFHTARPFPSLGSLWDVQTSMVLSLAPSLVQSCRRTGPQRQERALANASHSPSSGTRPLGLQAAVFLDSLHVVCRTKTCLRCRAVHSSSRDKA